MKKADGLPRDAQSILKLAAKSMFELFAGASQGMLLVDREARVVWINDQYRRFLPALGFEREEDFVGHPVAQVIQNTQMHQVLRSGKPILMDLLSNRAGTFVVSRIPLRDAKGRVIGALGIVLLDHAETNLKPLMGKFEQLQRELDDVRRELATRPNGQRRSKHTFASFVGTSTAALEVKRQARRAAQSLSPVLLLGETGTGKELLAHAIHAASARAHGPLVSVNIAAVPDTLLESEFFGVAPGAFTGADRKGRPGKFKLADGGTLFLDEIGDMPLALQVKLLRALQEGEIEPLGSNTLVPFDVRIIAATSSDLVAMVREGRFREDLYYRLNVLPIRVPALRDRRADIASLVEVVAEEIALGGGSQPDLSADALELLAAQSWRGNFRELRNVIEQAMMRSESSRVDADLLRTVLQESGAMVTAPPAKADDARQGAAELRQAESAPLALAEQVLALERRCIAEALGRTGGNKHAAAQLLGISRATLYDRMRGDKTLDEVARG